ncbi:hypothetical protein GGS20DRAFT_577756 [Poronia punctata]|nr:hypothetical protein GGS20DRAFT_577756 [Poronia punctata]
MAGESSHPIPATAPAGESSTSPLPSLHDSTINYDDESVVEDDDTDDDSSSTAESVSSVPSRDFPRFKDLPPELRHLIWRYAVPSPGINFFNVHSFPNDHDGCNRSTSPPWAYLDLRRLDIEDDDDVVFGYDPSTWQARNAIRQTCREARFVCAIPESKSATITLTRPKRGLFVRAGDGRLRTTPLRPPNQQPRRPAPDSDPNQLPPEQEAPPPPTEPVVHRMVDVHIDEILSLSVENCSFNLPHEEASSAFDADDVEDLVTGDNDSGWAFDPQVTPEIPETIPMDRLCANLARCNTATLRLTTEVLFGIVYGHLPGYLDIRPGELWPGRLLLMFDENACQNHVYKGMSEESEPEPGPGPGPEVVFDRFNDTYVRLPWRTRGFSPPDGFPVMHRLTKIEPEHSDIRQRYLMSSILSSPKRPART